MKPRPAARPVGASQCALSARGVVADGSELASESPLRVLCKARTGGGEGVRGARSPTLPRPEGEEACRERGGAAERNVSDGEMGRDDMDGHVCCACSQPAAPL